MWTWQPWKLYCYKEMAYCFLFPGYIWVRSQTQERLVVQCFPTLFDSQHPSFLIEQFGGTPSYNILVNKCQVYKLSVPLRFSRYTVFAAPRLRTTDVEKGICCGGVRRKTKLHYCTKQACSKQSHELVLYFQRVLRFES